jgi:hypothetical protein
MNPLQPAFAVPKTLQRSGSGTILGLLRVCLRSLDHACCGPRLAWCWIADLSDNRLQRSESLLPIIR